MTNLENFCLYIQIIAKNQEKRIRHSIDKRTKKQCQPKIHLPYGKKDTDNSPKYAK